VPTWLAAAGHEPKLPNAEPKVTPQDVTRVRASGLGLSRVVGVQA